MTTQNPVTIELLGLSLPWQATLAVVLTTFLLVVEFEFDLSSLLMPHLTGDDKNRTIALDRLVLYLAIPLLVILLAFRAPLRDFGFAPGDWQKGRFITLGWAVVSVVGIGLALRLRSRIEAAVGQSLFEAVVVAGLKVFTLEFFFRGFLLFALIQAIGPLAIVLQMVPHTLSHLGKSRAEVFVTIIVGTLFGVLAWWTNSFYYGFLIHWFLLILGLLSGFRSSG